MDSYETSFRRLIDIGIALSAEKNPDRLMEMILLEAKDIGHADGGTLYIRTREDQLKFAILRTDSLNFAQGGTTGVDITFPDVKMYNDDNEPNNRNVSANAAVTGNTIYVDDVYANEEYDFLGPKKFDKDSGYRSTSFLTVPLKNHADRVIGVLQLLNAIDPESGDVIPFSKDIQPLIEALASQAAVALENHNLLGEQKNLLDSFIALMAGAIDAKSPYTGGHCQRVPILTEMLVEAACKSDSGTLAGFDLTDDQWYEVHIGAWLHDCGKVTTPEFVVDKATKLETISDRIHEVRTRFEILKLEATIGFQRELLKGVEEDQAQIMEEELKATHKRIDDDFEFIAECNIGGEFMADDKIERVRKIAETTWTRTLDDRLGVSYDELTRKKQLAVVALPCEEPLLSDRLDHIIEHDVVVHAADPNNPYGFKVDVPEYKYNRGEIYNLSTKRGTLTAEERFKINDHMAQTIVMLENLPFPQNLENVPEIAGGHHEKMDGSGYPKRLKAGTMSVPARLMAIADVFEALTAADRPYKKPKTLSESIKILSFMVKDNHLDPELFCLFLKSGVYLEYAKKFLKPEQIDEVDIEDYLSVATVSS